MLHRSRCSVCGRDELLEKDAPTPPCEKCGGKVYIFMPGPWVFRVFILTTAAAFFGFAYWFDTYYRAMVDGKINFVPGNVIAMSEFILTISLLLVSSSALVCAVQSLRGSIKMAVLAALFAAASFGYGISPFLAVAAVLVTAKNRREFYN